mgnify:CR=1 FL=1
MPRFDVTFVMSVSDPPTGATMISSKLIKEVFSRFGANNSIRVILIIPHKDLLKSRIDLIKEITKVGKEQVKLVVVPPITGKLAFVRFIIRNLFNNYLKTPSKTLFIMTENIHAYYPLLNIPFCRKRIVFWAHATPFLCAPPYIFKKGTRTVIKYLSVNGGFRKVLEYFFYQFCLLTLRGRDIIACPGLTQALKGTGFFRFYRFTIFNHPSLQFNFSSSDIKSFDAVYLARFIPGKGLADCLRIWKLVVAEIPEAKLLVIGPPKELVKQISKMLGISENVVAVGEVYNEEMKNKFLRMSKLLIYPSVMDSYSNVIAEALSAGLPVVCYDITPFTENFNLNPVIKVRFKDYSGASSLIIKLLKDHEYYKVLSAEASHFSKRTFHPKAVVDRFLRILTTVINTSNYE